MSAVIRACECARYQAVSSYVEPAFNEHTRVKASALFGQTRKPVVIWPSRPINEQGQCRV